MTTMTPDPVPPSPAPEPVAASPRPEDDLKIRVRDLQIRFRLSYDKIWTLQDKAFEMVRRVTRKYTPRYFTALKDINLEIGQGEIVGLIGPNGCGKTTLLRSICGIYTPDAGSVERFGRVSTLLSLGTGFDNRLNGYDNIRLNGLIMGMTEEEIEARIPAIAEFADIGEHIHQPMKYYSSGMISRVSFAIVLSMQPDILLIDEVLSVGDLEFQRKSEKAMHELLSQANCQVIVTHSLGFVREHCTRAVYMRSGAIVADGPPDEIVDQYERETKSA